MKKLFCLLLALTMVMGMVACGAKTDAPAANAGTADNGDAVAAAPSSISVCLASEPDTIDPALNSAVDGATLVSHLFSGLAKWGQDSEGKRR